MIISGNGLSRLLNNKMKQTQTSLGKTIGKLATGQRITAAADDASGLSISQKLRALQRGTNQALRNVQDASSLVQVADGAMQEMADILHRIRELTIQSMNGTYTEADSPANPGAVSNADKLILQNEIDELKKSLNDVVKNTEFNTKRILTNETPGEYIYADRTASKSIVLSNSIQSPNVNNNTNTVGVDTIQPVYISPTLNITDPFGVTSSMVEPQVENHTTVLDYQPRWTNDGNSIVFTSSRDNQQYIVSSDGNGNRLASTSDTSLPAKTTVGDYRLTYSGNELYLEKKASAYYNTWSRIGTFDYNSSSGNSGYSFSPTVDGTGNTSFVYSDAQGNIQKVDMNIYSGVIGPQTNLISTDDTLNIPPVNNSITLNFTPELYRMNEQNASLIVHKVNDNGRRELEFWDGTGDEPTNGYYTVEGNKVEFFGTAIIGNETGDDAQDYYTFSYVKDSTVDEVYTVNIPSGAQIYNMQRESSTGPISMKIKVDGRAITRDQMLSTRPADIEGTNGIYVNETTNQIEFYGSLRPAYDQAVEIEYMSDADTNKQVQTYRIPADIDTYNLTNPDPATNRSLRVYVDGREIFYDGSKTNGFTYDSSTGNVSIYGDSRSDLTGSPKVEIKYIRDSTTTSDEVYGISLGSRYPEIYNLGSEFSPNSIRVYRGNTEIPFSDENGYQYNQGTNSIFLYGSARPDIGDTYNIRMVVSTSDYIKSDGKVEVGLSASPETYGIDDTGIPSTFKVKVNGQEISYDENKQDGFYYNSSTNRIEIYGDSRPNAASVTSPPDIEVTYVKESPAVIVGNQTYDFSLSTNTLDYGITDTTGPKAIRVYRRGEEITYNAENGYTYDATSGLLSLHGSYRPTKNDAKGDYDVFSINASALIKDIPNGSYIYKVKLNGVEITKASDINENGYFYDGSQVEIIGDARPDITQSTSRINLEVSYFDSLEISLNDAAPGGFFNHYCDHEAGEGLLHGEIDPEQLTVLLDGATLNPDQYTLNGDKIKLKQETLSLGLGNHQIRVDYRVRHPVGFEPNEFTFQVGANAGDTKKVEIASFDNMLRDTNVICVRTFEDAGKGLTLIDKALGFVLHELGNIGAVENSLDHIAANLSVLEEQTTSALSRIMDSDMAKEVMNLTRLQILSETQKAMASHVRQSNEQILEILK